MSSDNARDVLAAMGISVEEAVEVNQRERQRFADKKDKRICLCGHPVKQHMSNGDGTYTCTRAKVYCPCRKIDVALEAEDARLFMFKTAGPSARHALVRGIAASVEKDKDVTWVMERICFVCGVDDGRTVVPMPATKDGRFLREGEGPLNALVCEECRNKTQP